jgi:hypothetical protein
MLEVPVTDLSRLIVRVWFEPLGKLARKSGVPVKYIQKAIAGEDIGLREKQLREFLENYKGAEE